MKKLTIGHGLEQRKAFCNFCEEGDKDCIKGSLETTVFYQHPITELSKVIEDYKFNLLNKRVILGGVSCKPVVITYEDREKKESADICIDCIRQLYKITK